ncbi:MAG: glycoside hydrolase family 71 protein [Capsulimonadaceae bacterium]|nr:glycoside hydrolase family 71 protein [Capsulimonadaceae bacterium]
MNIYHRHIGLVFWTLTLPIFLLSSTARAQAPLPFDRPALSTLRKSQHKVFAHYFTPFPISIDNRDPENDYYAKGYLDPHGERDKWLAHGGFLRERPLPRAPLTDPEWTKRDIETDVRRAVEMGIDGFTVDLMGEPSERNGGWRRTIELIEAAQRVDPDFKIVPMPDLTAGYSHATTYLTDAITALSKYPNVYRLPDGRMVVSPYCAHIEPPAWWAQWLDQMKAQGVSVALVPLFQGYGRYLKDYAPVSIGASDWGTRGPTANKGYFGAAKLAHESKLLWMAPVAPQDYRPKDLLTWEGKGSEGFRQSWTDAIDGGADWVQLITWNDYSESSEVSPSTGTQWSFYDLCAYYTAWFKSGKQPKITRDVLYYFHRVESVDAPFDADKQMHKTNLASGADPLIDEIEVLAFLTKPGVLETDIAGKRYTMDAPAGITSFHAPLATGTPRFKLLRKGKSVIDFPSAFPVVDKLPYQDLLYRGGSSSRPPVDLVQTAH